MDKPPTLKQLIKENNDLRGRLLEAEETLQAIRNGEVDALVVSGKNGDQIFTLNSADHPYRVLIEDMNEGALTLSMDGSVLYCNPRFSEMVGISPEKLLGLPFSDLLGSESRKLMSELLDPKSSEKSRRREAVLLNSDGSPINAYLSINSVHIDEMPVYYCMVATDLTEQKRINAILENEKLMSKLLVNAESSRRALLSVIEDQKIVEDEINKKNKFIQTVLDNLPLGVALNKIDGGDAFYTNKKFEEIYGWPAEEVRNVLEFFEKVYPDKDYRDKLMTRVLADISSSDPSRMHWEDCIVTHKDGSKHFVNAVNIPLFEQNTMVSTVMDNTERKKAEIKLIESEEKYKNIVENSNDVIWSVDLNGVITEMSESCLEIYGYHPHELIGKNFLDFVPKEQIGKDKSTLTNVDIVNDYDSQFTHKDGHIVFLKANSTVIKDKFGNPAGFTGASKDVTNEILAKQEIIESESRLRALSAKLQLVREEERLNLSRELHDNVGQILTGLKMDASFIEKKIFKDDTGNDPLKERFTSMIELINESISIVRKIASDLRPTILDSFGLLPAIEWLLQDVQKRSGINCRLLSDLVKIEIGDAASLEVFRIVQESLTNVIKHSEATEAVVKILYSQERYTVTVEDNGKGFELNDSVLSNGIGLIGMRERVIGIKGGIEIEGRPGLGTLVKITFPYGSKND